MKALTLILAISAFAIFGCASVPHARLDPGLFETSTPTPTLTPENSPPVEIGTASFYHPALIGRRTASGARYSDKALTAAHRTLELGTRVRVTNLENSRSVIVTVNDRGPYAHGRIIDLSRRAARALGFVHEGLARVRVQPLT
jgi:rare lipoprotein A